MYCTKCGWKNADDATHCANCSADLREQSAAPQQAQQPQQTQYQQYPQQNNYQQYPPGYQGQQQQQQAKTMAIIGIVLGALSLLTCPLLFGGAGITLGAIAMGRKEKLGLVAIIVSIVCMVISIVIGITMGIHQFKTMQEHGFKFPR